jgi:hypothetical protein
MLKKYAKEVVVGNFMSKADVARHNSEKIAEAIVKYIG